MKSPSLMAVVVCLLALVLWLGSALVRVENQRYALAVGLCTFNAADFRPMQECLAKAKTRTSWWAHLYYALTD